MIFRSHYSDLLGPSPRQKKSQTYCLVAPEVIIVIFF